jgi:hypothetical protein
MMVSTSEQCVYATSFKKNVSPGDASFILDSCLNNDVVVVPRQVDVFFADKK